MGNREAFKKVLLNGVRQVITENNEIRDKNLEIIENWIDGMTKDELDQFVKDYENGDRVIPLIIPNGVNAIDYEKCLDLLESLGMSTHKRLRIVRNGVEIMSPIPRLLLELPLKKPIQLLDKKRAISENQDVKNSMTGQVTGPSKSMSVSSAEVPLMLAVGLKNTVREFTKYRGGDKNSELVMAKLADSNLEISQETLERYSEGPEVNNTLKQYLLSMHIEGVIGDVNK